MTLITIIFAGVVICVLLTLVKFTRSWADALRREMLAQSKRVFGTSMGWDRPWTLYLCRAGVIFLGVMFILGAYIITFGPIYTNCDANCQAAWQNK